MKVKNGIEIHDEHLLELFTGLYGEPLGYGITAIVYEQENTVIKVFYPGYGKDTAFKEAHMLAVAESGNLQAPRVLSVSENQGYWELRMTKVEGESLLKQILDALTAHNVERAAGLARQLADIHVEINSKDGTGLADSKNVIRAKILDHDVLTEKEKERAIAYLEGLEGGNALCHGDFHANQIMIQEDGSYRVIDFADIGCGNPAGDVALTWLNLSTPPAPLRELFGQVDLPGIYLEEYLTKSGMDRKEVEAWISVQAAAFLSVAPPYREELGIYLP